MTPPRFGLTAHHATALAFREQQPKDGWILDLVQRVAEQLLASEGTDIWSDPTASSADQTMTMALRDALRSMALKRGPRHKHLLLWQVAAPVSARAARRERDEVRQICNSVPSAMLDPRKLAAADPRRLRTMTRSAKGVAALEDACRADESCSHGIRLLKTSRDRVETLLQHGPANDRQTSWRGSLNGTLYDLGQIDASADSAPPDRDWISMETNPSTGSVTTMSGSPDAPTIRRYPGPESRWYSAGIEAGVRHAAERDGLVEVPREADFGPHHFLPPAWAAAVCLVTCTTGLPTADQLAAAIIRLDADGEHAALAKSLRRTTAPRRLAGTPRDVALLAAAVESLTTGGRQA